MKRVLLVAGIVLVVFLAWGFVGGSVADSPGVTCDVGVGESFCLKWHKNILGEIQEAAEDLRDAFEK